MPKSIVKEDPFRLSSADRRVTLTVRAVLDPVAGPWHEPEDLMRWIAQHSYVQSVALEDEESESSS